MKYILPVFFVLSMCMYVILIIFLWTGWKKLLKQDKKKKEKRKNDVFLSVIIALKNEQNNIKKLLTGLKKQTLNTDLYEIILVDDNSIDKSIFFIKKEIQGWGNFKILYQNKNCNGKKAALRLGINNSKGNIIVTTDADCTHANFWLKGIYNHYVNSNTEMLVGGVEMTGRNFFEKLQCQEFQSLIISGAGAIGLKRPIMCNGANFSYRKELYYRLKQNMRPEIESGDDIFLLHAAKRIKAQINFNILKDYGVQTVAEKNLKKFLFQRIRWGGKTTFYTDKETKIVAGIVFLMSFSLLLSIINVGNSIAWFLFLFIGKATTDYLFLRKTTKNMGKRIVLNIYILSQFFYPVYIFIVSSFSITRVKIKWK